MMGKPCVLVLVALIVVGPFAACTGCVRADRAWHKDFRTASGFNLYPAGSARTRGRWLYHAVSTSDNTIVFE